MRIAVLGGEARDLLNFRGHLMSEMVKAGHVVHGIAPRMTPDILADLEVLGVRPVSIQLDRTGLNPFMDCRSLLELWRLFRRLRIDMLLAYEVKGTVFGLLAGQLACVGNRFAMITGRGSTLQGEVCDFRSRWVRRMVQWLYRLVLRKADGVLFQNPDDLGYFREQRLLSESTSWKIINGSGVDTAHFSLSPLPEPPVVFLFVGRLLRHKGIHEYVEACRLIGKGNPRMRFQVLGPLDSNPSAIQAEEIETWHREGVIDYLGELRDVRPAIAKAHVLVLPSYCEGTPRSVLEAMSMGRAIVTTDAPGCRETVQDGVNGFLVPVRDGVGLANAMSRLASNSDLIGRMGMESRHFAEAKYDVRKVTAEILSFMGIPTAREERLS